MFKWIDVLNETIGRVVAWFSLIMALLMVGVVLMRYLFDMGTLVLQESILYLHGFGFMLAIPYTLMKGGHVRVDVLYGRMSARNRCLVDLTGHLFLLLPVCIFIFWTSLPYVGASWRILEGSADIGGIPAVFVLKTLIPVLTALLFLQGLREVVRSLRGLRSDA